MQKLSIFAIVVCFLGYFTTSCKPENINSPVEPESNFSSAKTKDEMLVFSSEKEFDKTVSFLRTLREQGSLDKWENEHIGFKSMRTAYNQITEDDQMVISRNDSPKGYERFLSIIGSGDDRQAVRNIMDDALSTLVNYRGLVKIGSIYRLYRYDATVEFSDIRLDNDDDVDLLKNSDMMRGIKIIPTTITTKTIIIAPTRSSDGQYDDRQGPLNEYWEGGRKKRVVGILWTDGPQSGTYNTLGGITKNQKRILGSIWYDDSVNSLRLMFNASVVVGANGGQNVSVNYDYTAQNQGYYNFSQNVIVDGNVQNFTIVSFTGFHTANGDHLVNTSW